MLQRLYIENFILIESANIDFTAGLNVITGETGAGKTSLLQALCFALGEKMDPSCIRHGKDFCMVEATFQTGPLPLLAEIGIEHTEEIVLKRVMDASGKSRGFINCQTVPQKILVQLGFSLLELISQKTTYKLRSMTAQKEVLDRFARTGSDLLELAKKKTIAANLQKEKEDLERIQAKKIREEDLLLFQLSELQDVDLEKEEEMANLHEELSQKIKVQEIAKTLACKLEGVQEVLGSITGPARQLGVGENIKTAKDQLQESLFMIETKTLLESSDFEQFDACEKFLSKMARLKKKYGQDLESIKKFKAKLTSEYESLCSVDEKLPLVIQEKQAIDQQIKEQEMAIFQKRKDASSPFSRSVHQKLLDLNLECDAFVVEVEGDGVLFYLQMGEKKVSCSEEISGGELARVTLAIKTVLAENNLQAALFFDEIDAHIGGETARKMALVLKELGQYRQVISISHFPQVASLADSHIMVKKQGQKAFIMKLQDEQKSLEILRMMGGSHPLDKLEVDIWTGLNPG